MRVNCFSNTGSLLNHAKFKTNDLIKTQGVKKISYLILARKKQKTLNLQNLLQPLASNEKVAADIIEETAGDAHNDENELIKFEYENDADPELRCEENMEDDSFAESVDEFDFQD